MILKLFLRLCVLFALVLPAQADEIGTPAGDVILTVKGAISVVNEGDTAQFDLAMLDKLEKRTIVTETPWYEEAQTFEGPLLSDLLDVLGVKGESVRVIALNDYSAEIPMEELWKYPVVLTTRIDGETLSVRDKGPLFVIYPFDDYPELHDELHFGRCVWQVTSIEIL